MAGMDALAAKERRPSQPFWQFSHLRQLSDILGQSRVGATSESDTNSDEQETMADDSGPDSSSAKEQEVASKETSQHTNSPRHKYQVSNGRLLNFRYHGTPLCLANRRMRTLLKLVTAIVFIPGLLAIIGAIMEVVVYGSKNAPGFHPLRLCYAGFIASPFLLVRWFWPWQKRLYVLEFLFYLLFTCGFLAAIFQSSISGDTQYYMSAYINSVFDGGTYTSITTRKDVYDWLESFSKTVYDDSKESDFISRELPGESLLFDRIRLKQSRSQKVNCDSSLGEVPSMLLNKCYGRYSRSNPETKSFSSLDFSYVNPTYKNYAGEEIFASSILSSGVLADYSLDGYWVMLPPNGLSSEVLGMLDAMRKQNWIDHQTRQISVDFVVLAKDLDDPVIANVVFMIEVTVSGKMLPLSPTFSFSYFHFLTDIELQDDSGKCNGVTTQKTFLLPIYLGILPSVIYIIFSHILRLQKNWRQYVLAVYTYSELLWVTTIFISIILRWQSIYLSHCSYLNYTQTIWPTNDTWTVHNFELIPMATKWELARDTLAVAMFLQFFNLLRYVARFGSVDTLDSTLRNSIRELAAFAFSFAIIFIGFVLMFHVIFGAEEANYHSISHCLGTLWLGVLGNIEFSNTMWRKREWSLPLVIFFSFLTVFVILTVVIAIISNAYAKTLMQRKKLKKKRILIMKRSTSSQRQSLSLPIKTIRLSSTCSHRNN